MLSCFKALIGISISILKFPTLLLIEIESFLIDLKVKRYKRCIECHRASESARCKVYRTKPSNRSSISQYNKEYALKNKDKIAKVSIGMRFVEAATGKMMWKAGQHKSETYMLLKPALSKVARNVVEDMVDYMPH